MDRKTTLLAAATLFAAAMLLVFAAAVLGQCSVDQWGNMRCQTSPSLGVGEFLVPKNIRWNDARICRIDGASGAHVMVCGRPFVLSCAHQTVSTFMPVGHTGLSESNVGGSARAEIVFTDERGDLSLWSLSGVPAAKAFRISERDPQPGETVTVAGFPMMQNLKPRRVQVKGRMQSGPQSFREDAIVLADTQGLPGESGAAVVNESGELAGVFWGAEGGYSCFCSASRVRRFLANAESRLCPTSKTPLVPVKPIPAAEAPPQPATPKPEPDIDWRAWEKAIQERLDKLAKETQQSQATATATANTLVKIESTIAEQKPCQCDHAALLARIAELEEKLTVHQRPAPSGPATPADEQFYYDVGPRQGK